MATSKARLSSWMSAMPKEISNGCRPLSRTHSAQTGCASGRNYAGKSGCQGRYINDSDRLRPCRRPCRAGIVPSLARQGGNVTVLRTSLPSSALSVSNCSRKFSECVADSDHGESERSEHAAADGDMQRRARVGWAIKLGPILEVRNRGDLEKAFEAASKANALAAVRMIDPLVFYAAQADMRRCPVKYRLPMIFPSQEDVDAADSCRMVRMLPINSGKRPRWWTKFFTERNPLRFHWSNRRNLIW
jgi:hypothetical protein